MAEVDLTVAEATLLRESMKYEASRLIASLSTKPGGVREALIKQRLVVVESVIEKVKEVR